MVVTFATLSVICELFKHPLSPNQVIAPPLYIDK